MADERPGIAERALDIFRDRNLSPAQRTQGFIDNMIKDPEAWVTGGDPATGAQLIYLQTLSLAIGDDRTWQRIQQMRRTGEIDMTKSDASMAISGAREALGLPANASRLQELSEQQAR